MKVSKPVTLSLFTIKSSFQSIFENNLGLLWFYFSRFVIGPGTRASFTTNQIQNLITHVFLRFRWFAFLL